MSGPLELDFDEIADDTNLRVWFDPRGLSTLDGEVYLCEPTRNLDKLNPATHVFEVFLDMLSVSGSTINVNLFAMCSKSGALWILGRTSSGGITDTAIYKVVPGVSTEKHAVYTGGPGTNPVALRLAEDPVEDLLYFGTVTTGTQSFTTVVRYDIAARTFTIVLVTTEMIIAPGRAVPTGPGYKITDVAVLDDQSLVAVGYQTTDTNDPSSAANFGRPFVVTTNGKPGSHTTAINVLWPTPPLSHATLGGTNYCVPLSVTVGPDGDIFMSWQVLSSL